MSRSNYVRPPRALNERATQDVLSTGGLAPGGFVPGACVGGRGGGTYSKNPFGRRLRAGELFKLLRKIRLLERFFRARAGAARNTPTRGLNEPPLPLFTLTHRVGIERTNVSFARRTRILGQVLERTREGAVRLVKTRDGVCGKPGR